MTEVIRIGPFEVSSRSLISKRYQAVEVPAFCPLTFSALPSTSMSSTMTTMSHQWCGAPSPTRGKSMRRFADDFFCRHHLHFTQTYRFVLLLFLCLQLIVPQTQLIEPMIVIPPRHYCTIADPVIIGQDGQPEVDKYGQTKLRFGDKEIRFHEDYKQPFWLYPGEKVCRCQITS